MDTFHSEVARQAVAAGANMVNDVSGGGLDPRMADTVGWCMELCLGWGLRQVGWHAAAEGRWEQGRRGQRPGHDTWAGLELAGRVKSQLRTSISGC